MKASALFSRSSPVRPPISVQENKKVLQAKSIVERSHSSQCYIAWSSYISPNNGQSLILLNLMSKTRWLSSPQSMSVQTRSDTWMLSLHWGLLILDQVNHNEFLPNQNMVSNGN